MKNTRLSGLCTLMLVAAGPALAQGAFVFTTLPFPASDVDGSNRVVGTSTNNGAQIGAVWVNGTTTLVSGTAELQAVNSNGLAAGFGTLAKEAKGDPAKGPKATYVTYDIGSGVLTTYTAPKGTLERYFAVRGINDAGTAVAELHSHAYIISGDVFKRVKYPKSTYSDVSGINDSGLVSGAYRDKADVFHSYTLTGRKFTPFDPPGAVRSSATGTTDSGITYGQFTDSSGNNNGYVLSGGSFSTVQYPGAPMTVIVGIGPGNEVVGYYGGSGNSVYGFVLVNGTYYQVGPEGYIMGVNALGTIVGFSLSGSGFIGTCAANQFPCTQ